MNSNMEKKLENLRKHIDLIDEKLLHLLAKRMAIVKKIGLLKKGNNMPLLDEERWEKLLTTNLSRAKSLGLENTFIKTLYSIIHEYALEVEHELKK